MRATKSIVFLLLAACHAEPDFDERYNAANQEIQAKADAIDAQLEQTGKTKDDDRSSPQETNGTHEPRTEN